jgi:ABC-type Zn uptake system ZnuABC Zn-binding protein ZnuA
VKVADSNVLIVNGAGFEGWLQKTIDNVGGQHLVIEASAGLASRTIREGEVAEMSNAELADAMCESASESQAQKVESGQDSSNAVELPAESGMFDVRLNQQTDGTFSGYLRYSTDEAGDFQIAVGNGKVSLLNASNLEGLEIEKTLSLSCQDLTQGNIIGLEKDGHYVLALTGFKTANAHLLIGPAGGQHHHKGDPHFWLNPINVIKYVENIRDGLIRANPQGRNTYVENADQYMAKLNELDTWIVSQVNQIPPDRRLLVTNHESFGYFADRYGFKIIGTIVPSVSSESSPSAEQLARLIDRLRQTNPKAIFLETGTNPQLAQQVASETGIRVITQLYTHSITGPDGPAPTYLDMMRYDTQAIVEALK